MKSDYIALLGTANFVYDYASSATSYDEIYKSPNNQYTVAINVNSIGVALIIKKIEDNGHQGNGTFPIDEIIEYYPTADGVLPVLEDENASFEGEYSSYDKSYSVHVTYETKDLATTAYDAYINQLKAASFKEEVKMNGSTTVYYAPDDSFVVWVMNYYLNSGEFYIDIYPADYFD